MNFIASPWSSLPEMLLHKVVRGMCRATRSEIFGDSLYTWASGPRLRQSRRHRFVRLSPCFRAQRSRCGPIDAMNVNNFSRRAQVAPICFEFLVTHGDRVGGSKMALTATDLFNDATTREIGGVGPD